MPNINTAQRSCLSAREGCTAGLGKWSVVQRKRDKSYLIGLAVDIITKSCHHDRAFHYQSFSIKEAIPGTHHQRYLLSWWIHYWPQSNCSMQTSQVVPEGIVSEAVTVNKKLQYRNLYTSHWKLRPKTEQKLTKTVRNGLVLDAVLVRFVASCDNTAIAW